MRLMRLLALGGLAYGGYRWLQSRPRTMRKVRQAVGEIGRAARTGNVEKIGQVVAEYVPAAEKVLQAGAQRLQQSGAKPSDETLVQSAPDFLMQAGQLSLSLVPCARMAQTRGTEQAIRDLGQLLEDAHETVLEDLRKLASQLGIGMPDAPGDEGIRLQHALSECAGNLFDEAFVDEAMNVQIKLIDLWQDAHDRLHDANVSRVTAEMLPHLRQQEQAIKRIADMIHSRARMMPGPGTTEGINVDRPAA